MHATEHQYENNGKMFYFVRQYICVGEEHFFFFLNFFFFLFFLVSSVLFLSITTRSESSFQNFIFELQNFYDHDMVLAKIKKKKFLMVILNYTV